MPHPRGIAMSQQRIAPGLLIAMPQLGDPNFYRSVVLMVEHGSEGSLGLVVNRPSDLLVSEVVSSLGVDWSGDPGAVVWNGGPVQPRSGWLLHGPAEITDEEGALYLCDDIMLSTSPEQLRAVAGAPPPHVRFLLGYAGWASSQLELELAEGAWLLAEASSELVFRTPSEAMWHAAIRSLGVDPGTLFPAGGVH